MDQSSEGESLAELLAREGTIPVERATKIASQILAALIGDHARGIVRGDLEPANVLLSSALSGVQEVRLRKPSERPNGRDGSALVLRRGVTLGPPYFLAPEQIDESADIDERVDVYAIGAMLYRMVTGSPPFDADNVYDLVEQVLEADIPPPRTRYEGLEEALEEVIQKALAKVREDRFASAAEMLQALLPHLSTASESNRVAPQEEDDDTTFSRWSFTSSRMSWQHIAMFLAGLVFVIIGFFFGPALIADERPERSESADRVCNAQSSQSSKRDVEVEASASAERLSDEAGPTPRNEAPGTAMSLVALNVVNVPEGAVLYLDRTRVGEVPIKLRRSELARAFKVRVGGEFVLDMLITLNQDRVIDVEEEMGVSEAIAGGPPVARPQRASRRMGSRPPMISQPQPDASLQPQPAIAPPPVSPSRHELDFSNIWRPSGS